MAYFDQNCCDERMKALFPNIVDDLDDVAVAEVYQWPQATDTGWLRMNFAATIDGAVTDGSGLSDGVSSPDDKRVFAILRATCDAVLVGAGTFRAEGYGPIKVRESLRGLRRDLGLRDQPRLIIFSNSANLDPASSAFVAAPEGAQTIVVTCAKANPARVQELREFATILEVGDEHVDLPMARQEIIRLGLRRMLCEGGPNLFGDLLKVGAADDLCLTTSPLISGQSPEHRKSLTGNDELPNKHNATLASLIQANDSLLVRWLITKDDGQ